MSKKKLKGTEVIFYLKSGMVDPYYIHNPDGEADVPFLDNLIEDGFKKGYLHFLDVEGNVMYVNMKEIVCVRF